MTIRLAGAPCKLIQQPPLTCLVINGHPRASDAQLDQLRLCLTATVLPDLGRPREKPLAAAQGRSHNGQFAPRGKAMKRWIVLIGLVACGGCALYPKVPRITQDDIADYKGEADPLYISDRMDALDTVRAVQAVLALEAHRKRSIQLSATEVTHYAALAAVIGLQFDKTGAINTGAGVATLSSIFSGHYRLPEQAAAIDKAITSLRCLETRLTDIKEAPNAAMLQRKAHASAAPGTAAADIRKAVAAASTLMVMQSEADAELPRVTQWAIRRVLDDLRVAMAGLPLQSQSMEQLAELFEEAGQAKEKIQDATKDLGEDSGSHGVRGLMALGSFEEDAVLCVTTSAQ
jgi:hypothetical protein